MRNAEERLCSRCKKKKFLATGVELCSSCIVAEAEGEPLYLDRKDVIQNPIGMVIRKAGRVGGAGKSDNPGKRLVRVRESEE